MVSIDAHDASMYKWLAIGEWLDSSLHDGRRSFTTPTV